MKRRERWKLVLFISCFACLSIPYLSIPEIWSGQDQNDLNPGTESKATKKTDKGKEIEKYMEGKYNQLEVAPSWQMIGDLKDELFIYSAYYDDRDFEMPVVKLIGVTRLEIQIKLMCRMYFGRNNTMNKKLEKSPEESYNYSSFNESRLFSVDVPAKVSFMNEHHNFSHSACFILCPINIQSDDQNSSPKLVSIHSKSQSNIITNFITINNLKNIALNHSPEETDDIGVCVKPIYSNYNQTLDLIEFIELNKILGVSKFTFYNQSMSNQASCVLDYYSDQMGTQLSVRTWNLRAHDSHMDIHDEAGMAALNDCVYHNMKNVKYLLMIDLDEFIVPHMNNTLQEMLEFLNSKEIKMKSGRQVRSGKLASSYNFKNAFFYPKNGTEKLIDTRLKRNASVPLRVLTRTQRTRTFNALGDRSKYICIPKKIKQAGIHFVWEYQKGIPLHVPENMGFVHHYRNGCEFHDGDTKLNCDNDQVEEDYVANKFKDKLIKNVENVWTKLSEKCDLDSLMI